MIKLPIRSCNLKGNSEENLQGEFFRPLLIDFVDMNPELVLLANKIEWSYFDKEFAKFYSKEAEPLCLFALW
ncbi:MAG: hypothetical protein CMO34_00905 [Verrucomicrobia bacterium]|nr:hypothetical protein [Verrucomicrobiota bacterium]